MGDDSEWLKLPTDEKCVHKAWKARVAGYEEAAKVFNTSDEKSPEFSKYLGLVKKFVVDSNAVAQEKGLDAVLAFVENGHIAGKTTAEVVSGVITKCLNSSRTKTREKGQQIIMTYIEIEKGEIVQEELIKGLSNKQPKVVSGCIHCLREALSGFGNKTIPIKPMVKLIQKMLEDRDKTVREEMKLLVVEMYRWIGPALKPQLTALKPVQVTEMEAEFEKMPSGKPRQTRFLRSQQDLKAKAEAAEAGEDQMDQGGSGEGGAEEEEAVDPYDLMTPVDIIAKLPKDYYDKVEAKKWQERREALDAVLKLVTDNPRLEKGEYGDLVRTLKKVVAKDTNVMLVTLAAKILGGLALGLRKKFSPYASDCVDTMIEKFREKKLTVVTALREAVDAIYPTTTLETISETCISGLDHKTPSVKAETASYLSRCFAYCTPATLNKKLLRAFITPLLKTIGDTAPEVRESSFLALGMAMKVVGEKPMNNFLADVDPLKMTKIKECCDNAQLIGKGGKPAPKTTKPDPVKPPEAPAKKKAVGTGRPKTAPASSTQGAKKGAKKGKAAPSKPAEITEHALADDVVEEKVGQILPATALTGLVSSNWKERLAAIETITQSVKVLSKEEVPCQALVRTVVKKPGLKENNFQVMKWKVELLAHLAAHSVFTKCSAEFCLTDLADKIGDVKNGAAVQEALSCMAEACSLEYVGLEVLTYAFDNQKNPKNQAESLNWLSGAVKQFGFKVTIKPVVEYLKKAFAATNPAVRAAAIGLLVVLYLYMGPPLRVLFDGEKAALLQQIDSEFEKVKGEKPPPPTRGLTKGGSGGQAAEEDEEEEEAESAINVADLVPRNDISYQIQEELIVQMSDKNWKVRNEALQKVTSILNEAKFITPAIGPLPEALKLRLGDSNKILVTMTINICAMISTAMGPAVKQHVRVVGPGIVTCLGDSKPQVRAATLTCLNSWVQQAGILPFMEAEIFSDAIKTESPNLRAELLGWLADKLPGFKKLHKEELLQCVPQLYACLEDRSADVRKKAQEALLPFMMHLTYETMARQAGKVKASSKDQVIAHLDKVRPNLPAKPVKAAPMPAATAPVVMDDEEEEDERPSTAPAKTATGKPPGKGKPAVGAGKKAVRGGAPSGGGKKKGQEEEDLGPPMKVNNSKEQRFKEEKNLKVLKWNFVAPRAEFLDQLRSQMDASFSKSLVELIFHADFKNHLKALDIVMKACDTDPPSTIANLDLLLKWMTIRFFDTNTTVLVRCLEYLQRVCTMLSQQDYHMAEMEASAFIPYLVNKVGDPKDNIRRMVRSIIKMVCNVYPASKMFSYIIDGLKSKNAKQRTECLEELGILIESYGVNVCQPSPAQALKLVAQQISDRDNNVRSTALNTIVIAYFILGDTTYKYLGNLSDKDLGMLEERIKRSSKTKPSQAPPAVDKQQSPEERKPTRAPPAKTRDEMRAPDISPGKKYLDLEDEQPTSYDMPNLIQIDMDNMMEESIHLPVTKGRRQPTNIKMLSSSSDVKSTLDMVISLVGSNDIDSCLQSLHQIDELLKEPEKCAVLVPHVDQLIVVTSLQLRLAYTKHMAESDTDQKKARIISLYRCLLGTLLALFQCPTLAQQASADILKDLLFNLITALLDSRLNDLREGPLIIRSVNIMVVKIVEKSNYTSITSALIRLLMETVEVDASSPKFLELVMKCIWRMVRLLPTVLNELNIDQTLLEVHKFLVRYPSSMWRERKSDTPFRTVKTILHTLAKSMGHKILDHLTLIESADTSEVVSYLRRAIRGGSEQRTAEQTNGVESEVTKRDLKSKSPSKRLSVSTHDMLAVIFKKIGSKENTREGLQDLYDFKLKYPEADLDPFLKKSSSFFQNYIERGLKNIEVERKGSMKTSNSAPNMAGSGGTSSQSSISNSAQPEEAHSEDAAIYMARLKGLRALCGLDNKTAIESRINRTEESNLKTTSANSLPLLSGNILSTTDEEQPRQSTNNTTETNVDTLRKRLERIKSLASK